MLCELITQLKKLQKSAPESIDNTNSLDAFKTYLHVENEVERDLRTLLQNANTKQNKCLILVCGSAGDGKSHLVAYLKFSDPERLLDGYLLYNDATESDAPTQSALEKMAEKLEPFNDDNYKSPDGIKMIMAINLGTLNNFIESEQGQNFSELKKYIAANGILSGYTREHTYLKESVFQHVSFSDYQVFTLTKNGVNTVFLEKLLTKVFKKSGDVRLAKDSDSDAETAEISLDYALFEMVCSIQEGYHPTVQDKNYHTDFVSFVNRVIEFGSKTSRIFLVSKENPTAPKMSFEKTGFKYKFGVI